MEKVLVHYNQGEGRSPGFGKCTIMKHDYLH